MTEVHRVKRTGMAPLEIEGELIAESDGHYRHGAEQNRWFVLRRFSFNGGEAVALEYHTRWQGEEEFYDAAPTEDPAGALNGMLTECLSKPIGFPAHPSYDDRQQKLLDRLRYTAESQISELFD